jgi:hypothetical protein
MWRKTRKPVPNSRCIGTDPNRNWVLFTFLKNKGYMWNRGGTSDDPCSDAFHVFYIYYILRELHHFLKLKLHIWLNSEKKFQT